MIFSHFWVNLMDTISRKIHAYAQTHTHIPICVRFQGTCKSPEAHAWICGPGEGPLWQVLICDFWISKCDQVHLLIIFFPQLFSALFRKKSKFLTMAVSALHLSSFSSCHSHSLSLAHTLPCIVLCYHICSHTQWLTDSAPTMLFLTFANKCQLSGWSVGPTASLSPSPRWDPPNSEVTA